MGNPRFQTINIDQDPVQFSLLPQCVNFHCFQVLALIFREYSEFEEKVKRTVYLDNLSPQITESIVNKSVSQFRIVKNVQFIPNYLEKNIPLSRKPKQADAVVSEISHKPFMVGGMPRPVRAHEAKPEMFEDRPAKPGREIQFLWVDKKDPDFEVANRLKQLAKDHALEVDIVLNQQVKVEEKLAERQQLALKVNHEKFEMINGVITDGTAKRLANRYHIRVADHW